MPLQISPLLSLLLRPACQQCLLLHSYVSRARFMHEYAHVQIMVGPQLLVDPTAAEEAAAERHALVAMDASRQLVVHISVGGVFSAAELKDVLGLGLSACEFYEGSIKETLRADIAAQPA